MRILTAFLPALLLAGAALPAQAAIYSTSFSGTVTAQSGTTNAVGSTVAGSFTYSSDAGRFLNFTIGSFSAVAPYTSQATISPSGISNPYEVLFQALSSSAQNNSASNTGFALDLLAFDTFSSGNALTILTSSGLSTGLETQQNSSDGNYSSFSYSTGTSNSTTRSLIAALNPTSLSTSVPEPASLLLLIAPILGLGMRRFRR